jgi:uncharacterized protein YqeY
VSRRGLSDHEVVEIVRQEIAELESAAATYRASGHTDRAERLQAEAKVLREVLDTKTGL